MTGRARIAGIALATAALGAGCASMDVTGSGWAKPGARVQEVTLDAMGCARTAGDAGHTPDLILGGVFDVARLVVESAQERRAYARCMSGRGYRLSREELGPRELGRLARAMPARVMP